MQHYITANEGGGAATRVASRGATGQVSLPAPGVVSAHDPDAMEAPQRAPSPLALIMVVNGAIAGLAASFVFAAVEVAVHVLP